jgi:hypothetical protein
MQGMSEADLKRLAEALAALLAGWWRRIAQEAADVSPAVAREEHDAGVRS